VKCKRKGEKLAQVANWGQEKKKKETLWVEAGMKLITWTTLHADKT